MCFSDNNYAGDLVSRRSISGFIFCVLGIHVSQPSKAHRSIMIALSEAVKEIMFVVKLIRSMKFSVMFSVMVRVDNAGSILEQVTSRLSCAKHMDIRYK